MASSYHSLNKLNPLINGWDIRVRVLRKFKTQNKAKQPILGFILADSEGKRIEAGVCLKFAPYYDAEIEEGDSISITTMGVCLNDDLIKATDHPFNIYFLTNTIVKETTLIRVNPSTNLTSLAAVLDDTIDHDILIDVVGSIFDVGHLENTTNNPCDINGFKVTFKIKDVNNVVVNCEALKNEAIDFDRNYQNYQGQYLVVALRWWRINWFFSGPKNVKLCTNGPISKVYPHLNIPEVLQIREMYVLFIIS